MSDTPAYAPDSVAVRRHHRRHWYRLHVGECPVCGRDKSYRVRVYGKRPKRAKDRYVYLSDSQTYDWCDV